MKKPEDNKIISVGHLVKKYKKSDKNAVDDISFYVEKGAFFSLLGPNGAGKTTTVSILTTTLSKTDGEVTIAGYDLEKQADKVRKQIGVIFQNPSLDLNLTAEENIRIHANLYGLFAYRPFYSWMPRAYKKKINELAEVLGLKEDIFKPVKSFSGGMKRKLEIIRSLTHSPQILFLDEPTTGLDPVSRKNLWEYLQYVRETEKTTVFLTTHYLEEAEESDYLCVVDEGKIVSQGTPQNIKNDLIERYILIDAKDREKLKKELDAKKISVGKEGPFKIKLENQTAYELIRSINTPLTDIDVHAPTLEEAYLEIINKTNGN
jgi:ABC-2 type transport system ATP-binding protein